MGLLNQNPLRTTVMESWSFVINLFIDGSSQISGSLPAYPTERLSFEKVAATTGTYDLIFGDAFRPVLLQYGNVVPLGDEPGVTARILQYVAATGALRIKTYDGGVETDLTNVSLMLEARFTDHLLPENV